VVSDKTLEETQMEIMRNGDVPATKGPAANFTGDVRIDWTFAREAPSRITGGIVTFAPGARSAWHTHPLGQTLIVTSGLGWTQCDDGPITELRAGDVIWCPPGHKHWHGATPTTAMTHIAIQEALEGKNVEWMELVTDEEYFAGLKGEENHAR
jgi:quercetin dioxygenase-like cupin family protein